MNGILKAALRKIANVYLDQHLMLKFESDHGPVYVIMTRGLPYKDSMFEDLDEKQ